MKLRRVAAKVRDVAIGLGLIVAISFVPVSMTAEWPEIAQRAMGISREIRGLVLDVGTLVLEQGSAWLSAAGDELGDKGAHRDCVDLDFCV
ncbi:hypothetical protein U5801_06985 [Lamprobacter modestohalophilus]|uniref:hypothetical protein n=1 Tax=Lamprobacter modestohalophilus TaxID=1064514 RepID=UPI002ADEF217|nr:hypothetical protein [Lamprobacter modestohalophilus]MEA1049548.1 hypothetical protein [Lamprobacter modestohalophilus]